MLKKPRRRTHPEHKHPIFIAKRAGLGISGALNGAIATAYLMDAGVTFFDPVGMAAALMIFGWTGGFIGVTPTGSGPHPLQKGPQPEETLSAAGTFIANAVAFIAACLLLSHVPSTIPRAIAIGFCWLFGVTLQIAAGILARLRAVDPEIA